MRCGMPVTFFESLLKLPQDIRKVRPTILLAPPRMWERIYSTICTELRKRPAAVRKAFYGALGLGLAAARYRREGKPVPARIRVPAGAGRPHVLPQGARAASAAASRVAASPARRRSARIWRSFTKPSACRSSKATGSPKAAWSRSIRWTVPSPAASASRWPVSRSRFSEDGEILVKSPCLFSGYLNDPATTAEVLRDGWLHTGDIGHVDSDGYVFITGRKKELIVSSTGKKIYPSRVESLFKMEPLISQVLLIGDRLPYLTALFTINIAAAEALKGMEELKGRPPPRSRRRRPCWPRSRRRWRGSTSSSRPSSRCASTASWAAISPSRTANSPPP